MDDLSDLSWVTVMIARDIASYIARSGRKLGFLRENFLLLITWPIVAVLLGVIGWSALFSHLDEDRVRVEKAALDQSAALARSYADHLMRTVESVDQALRHVKFEWLLSDGHLRLENIKQTGLFPATSLLNVAIIDADGMLFTRTNTDTEKVPVADLPYFLLHKNADRDFLHIGPPAYSRVSKRVIIPFSRRLEDRNGRFAGVVVAAVAPGYLTDNYDEATLGKNGLLAVVGPDAIIRVTRSGQTVRPPGDPLLVSAPPFAPVENGSVILDGQEWFSDRRSRFVGWRAVVEYPLIAVVGLDEQDTLAPYRANRAASIHDAILATLALAAFTLIAMALSMRLAWRKHKMESAQATYRMATEEGDEGFYIARALRDANGAIVDFEVVDSNQRGAEMLRERREELIGKRISALYEGANPERLMGWLRQAMKRGFYEADVEVTGDSPLTVRWAHLKIVRSDEDLAITLRDISETKAHVAELERRGNEDALTGLPNRHWAQTYLPRAIEHAAQSGTMLALLFVDLDGFKKVNDTMGHAAGDELLRTAARRLKDAVRPHDHVVRLGGDEFLVIIEQIDDKADAAHVAERVVQAFRQSFKLSKGAHAVGTSIGISTFPADGSDADTLLHNADIAMYSVKTAGKGNFRFYDQKFYDALRARLEQESELRYAIEHDQFVIHYQPCVDMTTGTISCMEALVRWAHPTHGLLEPLDFIPLAEETGLILALDELVIDNVCSQLAHWAQRGGDLVPVSVNVSARQFNEVDVVNILAAAVTRHHIEPSLLEVEVTESSMMGNSAKVLDALVAIRRTGIKLVVDDFGTGYSSLSQLQQLDFHMLKVDRAFTSEIDRTERGTVFFNAIITMAHAIGMRVVAEGVENENQIKILKSLRCDEIQGFYVCRPLPPSESQLVLPKRLFPSTA